MIAPLLPSRLSVRLRAPALDALLAAGEDPSRRPALARRGEQLVSRRRRRQLAAGLVQACTPRRRDTTLSAAISVDPDAVEIARPALQQLARALLSRRSVSPKGVALTQILLTGPGSAMYAARYPEELYERAREALLAL